MDLAELLSRHPGVRLAGPSDNEALLRFFDRAAIEGDKLRLRVDRGPDFFALSRLQSPDFFSFLFEDRFGSVQAVATVLRRAGYVHGREETVGYLGDLRTHFHRGAIRAWREIFREILAGRVTEFANCRHWLTAVIDGNPHAKAALLHAKRGGHRYDPLTRYWMVNIFARPLFRQRHGSTRVRPASVADLPRLTDFLDRENRNQAFGVPFASELGRRLALWPGLRPESFLIAEAPDGRLLGCMAPWESTPVKHIRVDSLPLSLRILAPLLPERVRLGDHLRILYLTHLTVAEELPNEARGAVFRGLFDEAWRTSRGQGYHMVSFCSFASLPYQDFLEPGFRQEIPMTLYSVSDGASAPEAWSPEEKIQPGFEMAIV